MKKLLLAVFAFFICLPGLSQSAHAVEYQKTTATAIAASQDKAISKALAQAVGQVNGRDVADKVDIRETDDRIYMGLFGNTVEMPGREINRGYTQSFSKGFVRRYTVTNVEYLKDNAMYKVTVEAEVQAVGDYQNIGADRSQLVPLVVAPLKASRASYDGLNGPVAATELVDRVTDELSTAIAQSNRFRVLDRANLTTLLSEDFVTGVLGQRTGQQVKFSQKLSADIVVVGSIRQFDISNRQVESYGQNYENYEGELVLDVRAVETATGEVRFAKRFEEYLDHDQIKAELDRYGNNLFNPNQKSDKRRVQYAIESLMIERVANAVVQAFYPDYQPVESAPLKQLEPDEKTPLSDSPGSSEKPVDWGR